MSWPTFTRAYGEAAPGDFRARITLARALLDIAATDDTHGRPAVHDGTRHYGGRAPGQLAELLNELRPWPTRPRRRRNGDVGMSAMADEVAREHGSRIIAALERAWAGDPGPASRGARRRHRDRGGQQPEGVLPEEATGCATTWPSGG